MIEITKLQTLSGKNLFRKLMGQGFDPDLGAAGAFAEVRLRMDIIDDKPDIKGFNNNKTRLWMILNLIKCLPIKEREQLYAALVAEKLDPPPLPPPRWPAAS